MTTVSIMAAVLLGAAFVVAGASKLAAGAAWPAQALGLGVSMPIARIVPIVELIIGASLVVQLARPWPAIAALTLLAMFTALIGLRLSQGRHPPCACFGAWSAEPIGAVHLARNGALAALGLLALLA
ncbi:MAG: MauE/DoxX family redox-associated membrane protein [Ilumatobacteraceae bacterium]